MQNTIVKRTALVAIVALGLAVNGLSLTFAADLAPGNGGRPTVTQQGSGAPTGPTGPTGPQPATNLNSSRSN